MFSLSVLKAFIFGFSLPRHLHGIFCIDFYLIISVLIILSGKGMTESLVPVREKSCLLGRYSWGTDRLSDKYAVETGVKTFMDQL